MDELISLKNISKTYLGKVRALENLSLSLLERESLVLLGPNGAGKTTLIKIITGLLSPDSGEILVKGKKFSPGSFLQKLFGLTLQEIGLWDYLTIEETLLFTSSLYGVKSEKSHFKTAELLKDFDLETWRKRRAQTLSDGLKRRLSLACSLVHEPEILILDEPTLALDPQARALFWGYLERLLAQKKMTLVFSTHDMEEADRFGTKVAVLNKGKLIELDSPSVLKSKYGKGDEISFTCQPSVHQSFFENQPGFARFSSENSEIKLSILNGIQQIPLLMSNLKDQGIQISNLKIKPNTLEQVFLSLTGESLQKERME